MVIFTKVRNCHFNVKSRNQSFKLQECQAISSIKCYVTLHKKGDNEDDEFASNLGNLTTLLFFSIANFYYYNIQYAIIPEGSPCQYIKINGLSSSKKMVENVI